MAACLIRRVFAFAATLFVVSLVVFLVMNALPGDPALVILGIDASPDAAAALRAQFGLDAPLLTRWLDWSAGALTGDFGVSYTYGVPVSELIAERLPVTVPLALLATFVTTVIAISLGVFAASRHGRIGDWAVMMVSQLGIAVPAFWSAILLVLLFAVKLRWLPPGGFPGWLDPVAALRALILPTAALSLVQAAILTRVTRSSVPEVMRLDHARTARAKDLTRDAILWRHVLPNALLPIVTIVGLQFAGLVTGTIVIENVFYLPGLGRLIFQSITNRDLFTVQALVLFFAVLVVTANFIVDVLYAVIDPRLRTRKA